MRRNRLSAAGVPLLAGAVWLTAVNPATAQLMSRWGHPVFSIGLTPYDAVSTGHGNYPGSDGFIPGYGYYPGPGPDHYPWYDGPDAHGQPIFRPTPAPGPDAIPGPGGVPGDEAIPDGAVVFSVRVPADADLWFDGTRTVQRGSLRRFVTPALAGGHIFSYAVHARWLQGGREVDRTQAVAVRAGDRVTVDFLSAEQGAASLPLPRKIERP
ncbi:MAG TPA: TIGR03000 domain-containing protein [Gemmataceae bacterium]|jgi:uncharacterized protein (TIGR03000 family)|nr:TIGR03000 domain-containing protein [Gemmataceae bacterium]